jgi:hypothetical protein
VFFQPKALKELILGEQRDSRVPIALDTPEKDTERTYTLSKKEVASISNSPGYDTKNAGETKGLLKLI